MRWKRQQFERAHAGPYGRGVVMQVAHGYVYGCFGIEQQRKEWYITHIPTGACFLYSRWDRLQDAKTFCERMLTFGKWDTLRLDERPTAFEELCHSVVDGMGFPRRRLVRVG